MGERLVRNEEVTGSNPVISTRVFKAFSDPTFFIAPLTAQMTAIGSKVFNSLIFSPQEVSIFVAIWCLRDGFCPSCNVLGIPITAGFLPPGVFFFGQSFLVWPMPLSSVFVVSNALLLRRFQPKGGISSLLLHLFFWRAFCESILCLRVFQRLGKGSATSVPLR